MKRCVKCGADLQDHERVCSRCGEKNPGQMASAHTGSKESDRNVRSSAKFLAIVIMVAIGVIFLFLSSPKRPEGGKAETVIQQNEPTETQESIPQDTDPSGNEEPSTSSTEGAQEGNEASPNEDPILIPTEGPQEHDWVISADGSRLVCTLCDATCAAQKLELTDFHLDVGWNDNSGFGLNDNGDLVYWQIHMELLDLDAENVISVACSWDNSVISANNKTSNGEIYADYGWKAAKSGQTLWRSYYNYEYRQFVEIMLPDDKTIAGPQWIAVVGHKNGTMYLSKISFTLSYDGNYKKGTGWSVANISWG